MDTSIKYGTSKIFLKKPAFKALEVLHEVRIKLMDRMAQKAQALWRGYRLRKDVIAMNEVRQRTLHCRGGGCWSLISAHWRTASMESPLDEFGRRCSQGFRLIQAYWRAHIVRLQWVKMNS